MAYDWLKDTCDEVNADNTAITEDGSVSVEANRFEKLAAFMKSVEKVFRNNGFSFVVLGENKIFVRSCGNSGRDGECIIIVGKENFVSDNATYTTYTFSGYNNIGDVELIASVSQANRADILPDPATTVDHIIKAAEEIKTSNLCKFMVAREREAQERAKR